MVVEVLVRSNNCGV